MRQIECTDEIKKTIAEALEFSGKIVVKRKDHIAWFLVIHESLKILPQLISKDTEDGWMSVCLSLFNINMVAETPEEIKGIPVDDIPDETLKKKVSIFQFYNIRLRVLLENIRNAMSVEICSKKG